MDAPCIPHLFCPHCGSFVGARPACPNCKWKRDGIGLRVMASGYAGEPLWPAPPKPDEGKGDQWPATPRPLFMGEPGVWRHDKASFALYTRGHRRRSHGEYGGLHLVNVGTREIADFPIPPDPSSDCSNAISGVTIHADLAFLGDETGRVHCFDLLTRRFRWSTSLGDDAIEARPILHDGRLIVTTAGGQIAILIPSTGARGPSMRVPGNPRLAAPMLPVSPLLGYVSAHISDTHGAVYAVDLARSTVSERPLFEMPAPIYTRPALRHGRLWVATYAKGARAKSELIAFDLKTGRNAMRPVAGLQAVRASPVTDGERLYFGDLGRNLYCVNMATVQVEPGYPIALPHSTTVPMALTDELLIAAGSHGELTAIDTVTRAEVWRHRAAGEGQVLAPPLVVDGVVLCPTPAGEVSALPYHHSQWEWAQKQAARNAQWLVAAAFAHRKGGDRAPQNAAQVLSDAGRHADAAVLLRESLPADYVGAGREFELAARSASDSAAMLDEAAACYSLNKDWPDARRCMREAARARKGPHLKFNLAAVRGMKIGDDGIIEFALLNEMPADARTIAVSLSSQALADSRPPDEKPQLAPNREWRERFTGVRMARSGPQPIRITADYFDIAGHRYRQTFSFELDVAARDQPATHVYVAEVNVAERMVLVSGDVGKLDVEAASGEAAAPARGATRIRVHGDLGAGVLGPGDDLEVGGSAGYVKVVQPRNAEAPGQAQPQAEARLLAMLGAKDRPPGPIGFGATPHAGAMLYCVEGEFDIGITAQTGQGPRAIRLTLRCAPGGEAAFLSRCGRERDTVTDADVRALLEPWAQRACATWADSQRTADAANPSPAALESLRESLLAYDDGLLRAAGLTLTRVMA
jgi:outer membrane protein assembly factor BamB